MELLGNAAAENELLRENLKMQCTRNEALSKQVEMFTQIADS